MARPMKPKPTRLVRIGRPARARFARASSIMITTLVPPRTMAKCRPWGKCEEQKRATATGRWDRPIAGHARPKEHKMPTPDTELRCSRTGSGNHERSPRERTMPGDFQRQAGYRTSEAAWVTPRADPPPRPRSRRECSESVSLLHAAAVDSAIRETCSQRWSTKGFAGPSEWKDRVLQLRAHTTGA